LKGIHVMRVHDHTEQLAAVHALPALLAHHPRGQRLLKLLQRVCAFCFELPLSLSLSLSHSLSLSLSLYQCAWW
jgi:hypothetical protein